MPSRIDASTIWPMPARARLQQRRHDAQGRQRPATAEVTEHIQRRHRFVPAADDRLQRPGQGDVVDVVPGLLRPRAILAPPGHPGVDQPRIAGHRHVGSEAETLGHPGPEAFEQHVRARDEIRTTPTPSAFFRSTAIDRRPRSSTRWLPWNTRS